jgi:cell filamentation protein
MGGSFQPTKNSMAAQLTLSSMKYELPDDQGEVLPNLLGLTEQRAVELAEAEGFLRAEITLYDELDDGTAFDLGYLRRMHQLALGHLYAFAGKWREVNLSKGGFNFPSAKFLVATMREFEQGVLKELPDIYEDRDALIRDIAHVHGELLFIHPFREGNGRTARLLADMMAQKQGYGKLQWERIGRVRFDEYVQAVQQAALNNRPPMEDIIRSVFPD